MRHLPFLTHRQHRNWPLLVAGLVIGGTIGAALMWLLDPDRGRGRRAQLIDESMGEIRAAGRAGGRNVRRVRSQVSGTIAAVTHGGDRQLPANDAALVDKVRSELGGDPEVPLNDLLINAERGTVVLRGEVDLALIKKIERKVQRIPGVADVDVQLRPKPMPIKVE